MVRNIVFDIFASHKNIDEDKKYAGQAKCNSFDIVKMHLKVKLFTKSKKNVSILKIMF